MGLLTQTQQAVLQFVLLFLLVAPLFPFLYLVLRWRAEGRHAPGMGTYGALNYFATVSLLLMLAGSANLIYGWMSTTDIEPFLTRLSWGLFVGSLLFLVLNGALLWIQRAAWPDTRRVFVGFLMVMAGLVTGTMLVLLFITLFEETGSHRAYDRRIDEVKLYGSWAGHFLLAYLVAALTLVRGTVPGS